MEQFSLPLTSFDALLLPAEARAVGSDAFRQAISEFFRQQICELGVNGTVTVTPEQVTVAWAASGTDPVLAAVEKLKRGQLREGAQLLELIRQRRPDAPEVLYNLGLAWSEIGEPDRAVPILRHLTEVNPNHTHGRVALGVALGRLGDTSGAEEELAEAVDRDPDESWARKNLGGILLRLSRWAEARTHLEAAVRLAPRDALAWLLLGDVGARTGQTALASTSYQQARGFDPHGTVGEQAELGLNRLAGESLPLNADGVNPNALVAMIAALKRLRSLAPEDAKALTLQAALLGQNGLRFQDPARIHQLDGIPETLTALEVACLIHAGVQTISPGAETGLPFAEVYQASLDQLAGD